MTKTFDIEGLDCANCAKRLEDLINKIPETECRLSFAAGLLRITAPDYAYSAVMKEVRRVARIVEPEVVITEKR